MSKKIYESDRIQLTEYWDGEDEQKNIQINSKGGVGFIQCTQDTALELIEQLTQWIKRGV